MCCVVQLTTNVCIQQHVPSYNFSHVSSAKKTDIGNYSLFCQVLRTHSLARFTEIISAIGGFRDTYLGKQVVSRPGGPRAGMGSAGALGALRAPL